MKDRWAHCKAVKKVLQKKLDLERKVTTGSSKFEEIVTYCKAEYVPLVNCYLAWALLRRFEMALFVVRSCRDADELKTAEASLIKEHVATDMQHGLNCRQEKG